LLSFRAYQKERRKNKTSLPNYDKEKYREMILDAAETVLGIFGFERTVYYDGNGNFSSNNKNKGRRRRIKWYEEIKKRKNERYMY
jgi:hypothetical protein